MDRRDGRRTSGGFTLLELTVAVGIFAILSIMSYGGLSSVLRAEREVDRVAEQLAALQTAFVLMSRDIQQTVPRGIRDEFGDRQPAMAGGLGNDPGLVLTRAGWTSPLGTMRSQLRRVAYRVREQALERLTWSVLDRVQSSEATIATLATDILDVRYRFLDGNREWTDNWPSLDAAEGKPELPLAVEVSMELESWGIVQRIFRVSG